MKNFLFISLLLSLSLPSFAAKWFYYQVDEGETVESIGYSLNGNPDVLKGQKFFKGLPKPGKYFKVPQSVIRLNCNVNYLPRYIKLAFEVREVQLAYVKKKIKSRMELHEFFKNNPDCRKSLRPWKNLQFISYSLSNDQFEERNGNISTQTKIFQYAGVEYSLHKELGWVNPWVLSGRGRITKGSAAKGFTLGPQIDFEAGLGKMIQPNKQYLYAKYWLSNFDFVGDKPVYIGRNTQVGSLLGLAYEYIYDREGLPWIGEAGVFYNVKSTFQPEVNGEKKDLQGYALRLALKIPIVIEGYDKIFIQPSWQFMNYRAQEYNLYINQLALAFGLRF